VRSRALIERSAPMVSGVGAVMSLTMMLAELTDGDPDFGYVIRLGVLTLLLIAAPFALYLLHQTGTTLGEAGRRSAALLVMALFVFGLPFAASGFSDIAAAEALGPQGSSRSSWRWESSLSPMTWPCCGPRKKPAMSANHHARERGSASACRYPKPSCMCRFSLPCSLTCTSPSAPASTRCTGSGSSTH
jgi:hypothetical protein